MEFWWIAEQRYKASQNQPDGRYGKMSAKEVRERYQELLEEERQQQCQN